MKDYLNRGNCEQLLKHSFIRDCQEKQVKLQMKEYLDKIRKIRRGSNPPASNELPPTQLQSDDEEDEEDDNDELGRAEGGGEGEVQINEEKINNEDLHATTRDNFNQTLRENFKCVQHSSEGTTFTPTEQRTDRLDPSTELPPAQFPRSSMAMGLTRKPDVCLSFSSFFFSFTSSICSLGIGRCGGEIE